MLEKTGLLQAFEKDMGKLAVKEAVRKGLFGSGTWDSLPDGIELDPVDDARLDGDEVPLDELFNRLLNLNETNPIEQRDDIVEEDVDDDMEMGDVEQTLDL